MFKIITFISLFFMCFHAEAYQQRPRYRQQPVSRPPAYGPPVWVKSHYNYFKASMGFAGLEESRDASGAIELKESAILPINLAYGVSSGNIAFEGELGFAHHDFDFIPNSSSTENLLAGDLVATKLMFNGFFKTSSSGSNLYLGGGLGLLSVSIDGFEDDLSGGSLATQAILGAEIRTSQQAGFFIEYKYLTSVGLELENDFAEIDFDYKESSLNVGLKYYF